MNTAVAAAHPVKTPEPVAFQTATGRTAAAARDAAETRLNPQTNRIKTRIATPKAGGEITAKHPAAVATPLPQFLNFIYIGYRWPIKAVKATSEM